MEECFNGKLSSRKGLSSEKENSEIFYRMEWNGRTEQNVIQDRTKL